VEQVGEHADAALLDLGRLWVLGVVDEVAVEVLGDHLLRLGLHPGRHEGRQVAHRDPVEHELLADQPHGVDGGHAVFRQSVIGRRSSRNRLPNRAASASICSPSGSCTAMAMPP
jgi:hypothetical protein